MTAATVAAVWMAALLGSPHCVGMCGPFVVFSRGNSRSRHPRWLIDGAYNAGRLASYTGLGTLAGAAGAGAERLGQLAGIGRLAGILAGLLMVAWASSTLLSLRGVRLGQAFAPRLPKALGLAMRALPSGPATRATALGLLTALLPCGWLYVFVAVAGGTASALSGALVMIVFWSGTLPAMASAAWAVQRLTGRLRQHLPAATATLVLVFGLLAVAGRIRVHSTPAAASVPVHGHSH
jgi:sulfite exporter TauE/SafE